GAQVLAAEIGNQGTVDVVLDLTLDGAFHTDRAGERAVRGIVAHGEQRSRGIEHRHLVGREARHLGGYQMAYGHGGRGSVDVAGADDHRGRGLHLVAPEVRPLGDDDVDPSGLDAGDRLDGAGNLALKSAYAGNLLHEGGEAERTDIV